MKKVIAYNLSIEVIKRIEAEAKSVDRSKSNWLDSHLSGFFNTAVKSPAKAIVRSTPKPDNAEFEMVWQIYERKGNKKTSLTKFNRLSASQKALMADHLSLYVKSTPDKQFRKNLETYINQECWNDEVLENGRSREKTFETSSDRYEQQSKRLQEREEADRHNQNPALIQTDGPIIRR